MRLYGLDGRVWLAWRSIAHLAIPHSAPMARRPLDAFCAELGVDVDVLTSMPVPITIMGAAMRQFLLDAN
jgi:hypothetical protein